ncbi:hypothetical protein GQE99_11440 [Maritimibacter sp. DP07]|uniref:KAP NTPase domain-containing protein n=1 Tax=Maritimibacter harenae TaxID=2606218 RepID=A0A845M010_9RHOB|nr:P-loop NTPase fold protein [Maritimibacter harenae]MZR13630.1 hypothetical protein [Maritimibacter harenae]
MRITPPEANINIFEDGFDDRDLLSRKEHAGYLSDLVERIDQPLVISLDGDWGSGKSFFLKCWAGEHTRASDNAATVVYFDAFAHDFLQEPLVALTSSLAERIEATETGAMRVIRQMKDAAAKLWRPASRVALAIGTAGASEVAGVMVDAGLEAGSRELSDQIEDFWKKEDGRKAAMDQFISAITELTEPDDEGVPTKKIVFIVDELDRCRPDFALETLETIKHFFSTPGVHFVLGVNGRELENMVRVKYGQNFDARTYLDKFISVKMSLPDYSELGSEPVSNAILYFKKMAPIMGLDGSLIDAAEVYFKRAPDLAPSSIRKSQRILTEIALLPRSKNGYRNMALGYRLVIVGLVIFKQCNPEVFASIKSHSASFEDIKNALGLPEELSQNSPRQVVLLYLVWRSVLEPEAPLNEEVHRIFGPLGIDFINGMLGRMCREYIDKIELFDPATAS